MLAIMAKAIAPACAAGPDKNRGYHRLKKESPQNRETPALVTRGFQGSLTKIASKESAKEAIRIQ